MSDDRPDDGAPSDPRPSGRIRIVGATPATGEHQAVRPEAPAPTPPAAEPPAPADPEPPVVDDPNRFGAIPIISADDPPPRASTPPRGTPAVAADDPEPTRPAPEPRPAPAGPDLDDLDLPPTAAVPIVPDEPEPARRPEPAAEPPPVAREPEPEPEPAPAPRPAPVPEEDLDDIRVWAAPADDEDEDIQAGRSAAENPFADLLGDDDEGGLDALAPLEDDLPHWSEPVEADDAWAGVSSGPRWRGQGEESGEPEDFSDLIDETRVESPGEDEMIFDDVDEPAVDPFESSSGPPQRRNPYPDAPDDADFGGEGGGGGRDMQQAVLVGVGLVVLLIVASFVGSAAVVLLALGVIVLATAEFFTATRRAGYHPAPLVGLVGSAGLVLGGYWRGEAAIPLLVFLIVVLAMCWWLFDAGPGDHAVANMGITVFGVMYVGGLGSFAALLLRQPNGIGMLFGAILVTVAADVGGLFVGQRMGRSPLTAASPNKTVEGFVGGIVAAVVVSCLVLGVLGWFPWEFMDALVLGVVGGVMAPLGDLCESRLKRDLGVKDMGTLLPGHGGVLDRFDGLLFVLPATYAVVLLLEVYANVPS